MIDNDKEKSFLDGNTLLAIVLSIVFFIGWQFYIQKKYPKADKAATEVVTTGPKEKVEEQTSATLQKTASTNETVPIIKKSEQLIPFYGDTYKLSISSQGMGFKSIVLKKFSDRKNKPISFAEGYNPEELENGEGSNDPKYAEIEIGNFATLYDGQPIIFEIQKVSEKEYLGKGTFSQGTVEKRVVFDDIKYMAKINVSVVWTGDSSKPIETYIVDRVKEKEKASLFVPSYEGSRFFALVDGSEERELVSPDTSAVYNYEKVSAVAVDSQYFSLSFFDESPVLATAKLNYDSTNFIVDAKVYHQAINSSVPLELSYIAFMGPKKFDLLSSVDEKMTSLIDFGFFGFISKPILSLLKGIYGVIHNWGLAIILVTILIRLLLLPINISSHKSMSKMQKIQPMLKKVREKYKDDPQKVNQETMLIMKREKANPLGGCLPMLMQIPVFFALFTVIGQSIELYKSPFAFWIQDLSYRDPFFVLPVIVGALYFVQMQLTPTTTMDPTQAKVMKIIPLVFVFFMFSMPSGLTLYFAINTIFGIGQQFILQSEKRKAAAAA